MLGGLGNQLFQVAYALSLSDKYDRDIYIDTSVYDSYKIRSFSLENFVLNDRVRILKSSDLPLSKRVAFKTSQHIYRIWQKLIKFFGFDYKFGGRTFNLLSKRGYFYNFDNYYHEHNLDIDSDEVICIYGYFQSESYFSDVKDSIFNSFEVKFPPENCPKELEYYNLIKESNHCIALSMRLGSDYTSSSVLNVCKPDFFIKSLDVLLSKNNLAQIFVFSDEVQKAKEILKAYNQVIYIEGMKDYQSLRLMSLCNDFVISNSSFSWWGAYLSLYSKKKIIVPDVWYNEIYGDVDIYNPEFIRYRDISNIEG